MKYLAIIFLHILKAAGTSPIKRFEKRSGKESIRRLYDYQCINCFKRLSSEEKRQLNVLAQHFPFGVNGWHLQRSDYITILHDLPGNVISNIIASSLFEIIGATSRKKI